MTAEQKEKPDSIPTVLRLLLVVEEVARQGVPVTPSEINQHLGLPKPTIHRLFTTLEEEGFLQRNLDGKSYTPGARLRALAAEVLSARSLRAARLAAMTALAEDVGETCNLAIPDRDEMLYLERVETKWPLRIRLPVSSRVPLYCTASGKLYLSTLNDTQIDGYLQHTTFEQHTPRTITNHDHLREEINAVRRSGYAQDNQEFMEGMIALAVPINDQSGRLLSTIAFHAPVQRMAMKEASSHLPRLREAAEELSRLVTDET
ncbi:IclR family transcriptional regulator [Pelagibius sp. Alg239-R121]|uniref:IclR family transcriptional regulator n=1 Tax=Pelagibius sp. Alg239-R121 TaxID=2993448 RepID=UPI0024A711DF|nr:IclR family transcriptional regulator [Pelagibius sp. Alg239-R121]